MNRIILFEQDNHRLLPNDIPRGFAKINPLKQGVSILLQARLQTLKAKFVALLREYPIAIPVNTALMVISVILGGIQLTNLSVFGDKLNDFASYYYTAQVLVQNPLKIYDSAYLATTYNIYAFRYFPTVLLVVFYPLTAFNNVVAAYITFSIISYCINLASVLLLMAIIQKIGKPHDKSLVILCIATFFVLPSFVDCYALGQISCIVAFVLLLSLYFYISGREFLGSLCLGFTLFLKPISFFQIFFVLLIAFTAADMKLFLKRGIGIVLPLVPDALWFLFTPGLLTGFINVNFMDTARTVPGPSLSFSNIFVSFGTPSFYATVGCAAAALVAGVFILSKLKLREDKLLFAFIFGMLAFFIAESDVWTNQIPTLYPFLIIAAIYCDSPKAKKWFYALFLFYPAAGELLELFFISPAAIVPVVPIVSIACLLLTIGVANMIYRSGRADFIQPTAIPQNESLS